MAFWLVLRKRSCSPPLQEVEHVLQSPHVDTSQSVGHACLLQPSLSVNSGHALPPYAELWSMSRARDRVPSPQLCVQAVQSP
jgi:hypothetical protein